MEKRRRVFLFFLSLLLSLFFQAVPYLLRSVLPDYGNLSVVLYYLFLYGAHPVCAAGFPYLLTRKHRLPAILCFFHFGLWLTVLPCYPDGRAAGIVCLVIGVLSAAAGETGAKPGKARAVKKRRKKRG